MSPLLKLAKFLRLVEDHEIRDRFECMPTDVLIIPAGALVAGEIHTHLPVIVAGEMEGTINIRGDASILVMEQAEVRNGFLSADLVEINGTVTDAGLDVGRLCITRSGRIEGASEIRYDKLSKHEDAPINGAFQKRKTVRDGFAHIVRAQFDALPK